MLKSKTLVCENQLNEVVGIIPVYQTKRDALAASKVAGWRANVIKIEFRFMRGWCVGNCTQNRLYLFVKSGAAPIVLDATPKTWRKQTENKRGYFALTLNPSYNGTSEVEAFPEFATDNWVIRSKNGPSFTVKVRGKYVNDALMAWGGYRMEN